MLKKFGYIAAVLLIAMAISFSTGHFLIPHLELAANNPLDLSMQLEAFNIIWQFLLLGYVIGGVIFAIPHNKFNKEYLKLAGIFCVLGSSIMITIFGFGTALRSLGKDSLIVIIINQTGLTIFYIGIAISIIELAKEASRTIMTLMKSK